MKVLSVFFASVIACIASLGFASAAGAPQKVDPVVIDKPAPRTQPVARASVDANAKCGQWWQTAIDAGWKREHLRDLDRVMFRESRCDPSQHNASDPNTVDGVKGSLSLTQINVFWVQSTRYYPQGYLQSLNIGINNVNDLRDPYLNLVAALAVFNYGEQQHGCGWQAWAWKGC